VEINAMASIMRKKKKEKRKKEMVIESEM